MRLLRPPGAKAMGNIYSNTALGQVVIGGASVAYPAVQNLGFGLAEVGCCIVSSLLECNLWGDERIMTRELLAALTAGAAIALAGANQALPQSAATTAAPPGSESASTPTQSSAAPTPVAGAAAATTAPATTAPATTAPAATAPAAAPTAPSPEFLKRAREAGFRPETYKGVVRYCVRDDKADTGTHFPAPKRCYDESQVLALLDMRQQDRDALRSMTEINLNSK